MTVKPEELVKAPKQRIAAAEIKRARDALGLSQREFAVALHTPYGTYLNWEHGLRKAPFVLRRAIEAVTAEIRAARAAVAARAREVINVKETA